MNITSFNTGFSYQQSPVTRKKVSFGENKSDLTPVPYTVVSDKLIKVRDLQSINYQAIYINIQRERLNDRIKNLAQNSVAAKEDNIKEINADLRKEGMYLEIKPIEKLTSGFPYIEQSVVDQLKSYKDQ